jgi:DNA-binding NarL/FixJ family response regulator
MQSQTNGNRLNQMWRAVQSFFSDVSGGARRRARTATHSLNGNGWTSTAQVIIVALLVDNRDRRLLANVSSVNRWAVLFVDSVTEAQTAAANLRVPVILCDRDLVGADWRETVSGLASSSPLTCVVLISRAADNSLWEEVIRSGGYEVLSRPLRPEEVVRVIKLASSFWNSMLKMPAYGKRSAQIPYGTHSRRRGDLTNMNETVEGE